MTSGSGRVTLVVCEHCGELFGTQVNAKHSDAERSQSRPSSRQRCRVRVPSVFFLVLMLSFAAAGSLGAQSYPVRVRPHDAAIHRSRSFARGAHRAAALLIGGTAMGIQYCNASKSPAYNSASLCQRAIFDPGNIQQKGAIYPRWLMTCRPRRTRRGQHGVSCAMSAAHQTEQGPMNMESAHEPLQIVAQLRQALAADKLSVGFFLGAGCPCAVRVRQEDGTERALIPDIRGMTIDVSKQVAACSQNNEAFKKLLAILNEDGVSEPTIELMLNRIRALRDVAGKAKVRNMCFAELDSLDRKICGAIRQTATCDLPDALTPYHALAKFISTNRLPHSEIFTTNYDVLMEQALEACHVPYFDGFVGSCRPFFDQRAIEDDLIPARWSRLWKLHGSINWHFNRSSKKVFRNGDLCEGDELLIHPSHMKYDESRRMPYFVMVDRLTKFLRNDERPVALFVLGYSFSDDHINEAIIESLKVNASSACFALQYDKLSAYPAAKQLAIDNPNLSIFAEDAAIIRRRPGVWLAQPATDAAALKSAFDILTAEASAPDKAVDQAGQSELPKPCRFLAGDFKRFGEFLNVFFDCGSFGRSGISQ